MGGHHLEGRPVSLNGLPLFLPNIVFGRKLEVMKIISAEFIKGIVGPDTALENNFSQIVFLGRSNAGKSSLINSLTQKKQLARSSNSPGRTREINLYLINSNCYFLDFPGYGYAQASKEIQKELQSLIHGYLFEASYTIQKIILVIDAEVGPTELDLEMLDKLKNYPENILVVANKIDKVKPSELKNKLTRIQEKIGNYLLIPYSTRKKIGRGELLKAIDKI